jgi:pyruvate/2-oxoglutarate dehydrogenase complex dihydrolipoamide acyltransferase (E2) component
MTERVKLQGWQKISAATWGYPSDPQIYGDLEIDAGAALDFIEQARAATGVKLSMTHVVGKAVAHSLAENPDLNVRMHRGYMIRRETVDIFFIVSIGGGAELSGIKIERADEKPVVDIARELTERVGKIKDGDDVEFGKTKRMIARTPRKLLGLSLRLAAWLTSDRNLDLKKQGLPRQAFGSAMISSVGMFGIQHAYAPLSPYYRVPFIALVGEVAQKPVVVDGEVVPRPIVTISATMDHRFLDGFAAARLSRSAREYLDDPKRFEPAL